MKSPQELREAILERLSKVIDPETSVDVVHMRLIEDLKVDQNGHVSYTFRPSSPFCPLAIPLSSDIQKAVAEVEGVTGQDLKIEGFALGDDLTNWLKEAMRAFDEKNSKANLGE